MKVAVDYTAGVRQPAGVGRYTRGITGALARAMATDGPVRGGGSDQHRLTLLWAGPATLPLPQGWPGDVRTLRLPLPERWMTVAWQRLRVPFPADTYAGGADIVYAPDFALPPRRRAPGVVTVHDLSYLLFPETHYPPLRRFLEATVPRSIAAAALVFADSEQTRDDVVNHLGTDPAKVVTVLSAPDATFRPMPLDRVRRARERWGVADGPYLVSVGTIQPRKNLPVVFEALRQLPEAVRLVHVGRPGWLCDPIFAALDASGVKHRVQILQGVDDEDLAALYSGAVACVFPSKYEGFGLPAVEAMACGVPVIASHAGSLAEVVQDAGIIVDPDDSSAIATGTRRLMEDAGFRADLMARGFVQASHFSWDDAGVQVLREFKRVAGVG
ncbi:MAG: glycosyltransferase family 4 protein [Chloroflexi bacterium]|nr:glycosyltransferase family 4 protein [Chloroflexota bacterium]